MKRIGTFIQKEWIFLAIVLATALAAFLFTNLGWLGCSPFAEDLFLEGPVQAAVGAQYRAYVSDSSYLLTVTDGEDRVLWRVAGGDRDNAFDCLDCLTVSDNGDVYLVDSSLQEDGVTAQTQRILRFSSMGKRREVLYEIETAEEIGVQTISLKSPRLFGGALWFAQVSADGVHVFSLEGEDCVEQAHLPMENTARYIADVSFTSAREISAVMKNGDVYTWRDGQTVLSYAAREEDTPEYPSMVSELCYGTDGTLYLNDIGLRRILALRGGKLSKLAGWEPSMAEGQEFGEYPLNSNLNPTPDGVSVLTSSIEATSAEGDEYHYYFQLLDATGETSGELDAVGLSTAVRVRLLLLYLDIIALAVMALGAAAALFLTLRRSGEGTNNTLTLVLVVSLVLAIALSNIIFTQSNSRYGEKTTENLSNIADLIAMRIDPAALEQLNSPDDYNSEAYQTLDEDINTVLFNDVNSGKNVYAILYRVRNNVVCEVYRNDYLHGVMYPMAGVYEGSNEQSAIQEHKRVVFANSAYSEGSYTFELLPIYNAAGEGVGILEVGSSFDQLVAENDELYRQILILTVMVVVISMLLFSELIQGGAAFRDRLRSRRNGTVSPTIVRPVAFLLFFTANITTAFLPIYGMSLWTDSFPLPAELAAALPLSAELLCSAASALFCSQLIRRLGLRTTASVGAALYVCGNALSAFAGNLWVLIGANSTCGIGSGLLILSVNTWITGLAGEEDQNKGFVGYNAAYLAGMNCGTVIGSLVWDNFGIKAAYFSAAGCAALLLLFILLLLENSREAETVERRGVQGIKTLFSPKILRYYLFLTVPYLICASFLSFYFPIVGEEGGLSAKEISLAFLISGMISIYASSSLGPMVSEKMGIKRAMILSSFLYAVALFTLAANPNVLNCYIVIVLFAIADSFGLAAQSVYFAGSDEVKAVGESWALGINSTVESVTSAMGSVIFGGALLLSRQLGILVIAGVFTLLLALYVMAERERAGQELQAEHT